MVAWDMDPFRVRGGTAYAVRRLADQLTALGVQIRVLLPDLLDAEIDVTRSSLLRPTTLKLSAAARDGSRSVQHHDFCRAAGDAIEEIERDRGSDAVIAHNDECALLVVAEGRRNAPRPVVFWLHSLYDPPLDGLPGEARDALPLPSLLASAVACADVVATSSGLLEDAREIEWPSPLGSLQRALVDAEADQRILTVESTGCLPEAREARQENEKTVVLPDPPFVLFPGRPSVDKGFPLFLEVAERVRDAGVACVAVCPPASRGRPTERFRDSPIHWLSWLAQRDLRAAMSRAACVVLPSLTEGYGLAAAEALQLGATTLFHDVGGHRALGGLTHAMPVPLRRGERTRLYRLWCDLLLDHPDSWAAWERHRQALASLIDRWVDAVLAGVHRSASTPTPAAGPASVDSLRGSLGEQTWGSRLLDRVRGFPE